MTAQTVSPPPPEASPEAPRGPSLSPSRAADFKTCPLLFRFRTIDKLPEQPSADQVRGTLVHAVLERLFDLPAASRTPAAAADLVAPSWQALLEEEPELASIFELPPATGGDPAAVAAEADATGALFEAPPTERLAAFLGSAGALLEAGGAAFYRGGSTNGEITNTQAVLIAVIEGADATQSGNSEISNATSIGDYAAQEAWAALHPTARLHA